MSAPNLKRAAAAAMMGAALVAAPIAATQAQEAPRATAASYQQAPLIQGPMTGSEARIASENRVVIYFGEGIRSVDANVEVLRRHDVPALGVSGAPAGRVLLMVDGRYGGSFTQRDLDRASLLDSAVEQYYQRRASAMNTSSAPVLASK